MSKPRQAAAVRKKDLEQQEEKYTQELMSLGQQLTALKEQETALRQEVQEKIGAIKAVRTARGVDPETGAALNGYA